MPPISPLLLLLLLPPSLSYLPLLPVFSSPSPLPVVRNTVVLEAAPKPIETVGDWSSFADPKTKVVYYFNAASGESLWSPPPNVAFAASPSSPSSKPSFLSGLFSKKGSDNTASLSYDVSSTVLPHPDKVSWGGEDYLFTTPKGVPGGVSFGVFDGVSGAEKLDGVPLYSKTLAAEMSREVEYAGTAGLSVAELTKMLLTAAKIADASATGASTALVASIDSGNNLSLLNVGDCSLLVLRNGKVEKRSKELTHFFDCPYQLSSDSVDRPRDGTCLTFKLASGDVVIAGSDGVFDNITDDDVASLASGGGADAVAGKIAKRAREVSLDTKAVTPYAKASKKNGVEKYRSGKGGKVDDVCVVVVECR